jgi:hypothetical protein
MSTSSRDRINVDLRGLRAALFEQARAQGVSPSAFVRSALSGAIKPDQSASLQGGQMGPRRSSRRVRVSLRMSQADADALADAARLAGLAPGTLVATLLKGTPPPATGAERNACAAALVASTYELTTLSRDIRQLTLLLSHSAVRAAQEYRAMLETLDGDVRKHLDLSSSVLAELQPRRTASNSEQSLAP